jgi:hypothetical protein
MGAAAATVLRRAWNAHVTDSGPTVRRGADRIRRRRAWPRYSGDARTLAEPPRGLSATQERGGEVTKRPRAYQVKIRGIPSDLVRAEFDDVDLWEAPGGFCLRTGRADTATLYGLIKRIDALGLVLLNVDAVDAGESGDPALS